MSWKKKERELTPEEAIAMTKRELNPYWYGSEPLLAGVKADGGVSALPLNPVMTQSPVLLCFMDPTDFSGEAAFFFVREFHRRFAVNGVKILMLYKPRYAFMAEAKIVEAMIRKYQIQTPLVVDHEGHLCEAFNAVNTAKAVLLNEGKVVWQHAGLDWFERVEPEIQRILRLKDPGLALLPLFRPASEVQVDTGKIDLGRGRGAQFPAPGFSAQNGNLSSGQFKSPRPAKLSPGQVHLVGNWMQDGDRIATTDPKSELHFRCPSSCFSIVVQSLAKTSESAKVIMEMGGQALFDSFRREDTVYDDEGHSILKPEYPRLYQAAVNIPEKYRDVTLRFPLANNVAVAVYGIRFSEKKKLG